MHKRGFTLIETLVGMAVFLIVVGAAYQAYMNLFVLVSTNQYKVVGLSLANEQLEIARNMPYVDVGVVGGIPNGLIPHVQNLTRGGMPFIVTTTIRNVDLPFDGTIGGTPNDLSPADNKLVEVLVECPTCRDFTSFAITSMVAPKSLETASTNGALFVKVFDANGNPVEGATVHIENPTATSSISITDVTGANGMLQIVDAPPGVEAYHITVSKTGYSTAKTYTTGDSANPTPSLTHATVLVQQVTLISFSIDQISALSVVSVSPTCEAKGNINFNLQGSKLIGLNTYKYSEDLSTNASGQYSNNALEWDTYTFSGADSSYDIAGVNPLNPVLLNPGATQNVSLIVTPKAPRSLLIAVKDSSTQLPVADATVTISGSSTPTQSKTTGRGFINQTDWSGGGGQDSFTDQTKYSLSANIANTSPAGELTLSSVFGNYSPTGELESSTIDTGSASNFYNLIWGPNDQPTATGAESVKFQFASNASSTSTMWDFKGPDGTDGTYYTTSNAVLHSSHNGDRYVRYKVFLKTDIATSTPNISDVAFTFASECTPPGQVLFTGLPTGLHTVTVSKSGYTDAITEVTISDDWTSQEIMLAP